MSCVWAMGGAVASTSGPVLGGLLTLVSWRLIFAINLPVGAVALALLARTERSPQRRVPFDWAGQVTAVLAMGGLTYGAIEAGPLGFAAPRVLTAFAVGFAFIVGYYGLPFVMGLYLQQLRGLSPVATGLVFLPMMLVGAILTPFSARLAERLGARLLIGGGLVLMTVGLAFLAVVGSWTPVWGLAGLMILVGLAGPLAIPPVTAVLLNSVPAHRAGTASGIFNTSRQVGGALAVAVFGALLAQPATFTQGLRTSLLLAAGVALAAAAASRLLQPSRGSHEPETAPA